VSPADTRTRPSSVAGPDVPPPDSLPGTLVFAEGARCRLRTLHLADLALGPPGPATACRLWAAPRGSLVATALRPKQRGLDGLGLVDLGSSRPRLVARPGRLASAPSWSPDGSLLAWCDERGTVVLSVASGTSRNLYGCYPVFAPDGTLRLRPRRGERESPGVLGLGIAADGTVVRAVVRAASGFPADGALEIERRGAAAGRVELGRLYTPASWFHGLRIEVSPRSDEAALLFPETLTRPVGDDLAAFVDLAGEVEVEGLTALPFAGLAWSPDGAWLALSTGRKVLIYGPDRTTPVYVLPVEARSLAWLG
jgi:hypothetical protein